MPFGLTNAPATLWTLHNKLFHPYLDDWWYTLIVGYSYSLNDHVSHLRTFFHFKVLKEESPRWPQASVWSYKEAQVIGSQGLSSRPVKELGWFRGFFISFRLSKNIVTKLPERSRRMELSEQSRSGIKEITEFAFSLSFLIKRVSWIKDSVSRLGDENEE